MSKGAVIPPEGPGRMFVEPVHGLRGLSALLVFFCHVFDISKKYGFLPSSISWALPIMVGGAHGVQIFFLISGFLITGSVIHHADAAQFLVDRCIRIYPVFLLIHLISFGLGPLLQYKVFAGITLPGWCRLFVENLFFLPGVFPIPAVQTNAWSLSYEALFYLVAALTYVVGKRLGSRAAASLVILVSAVTLWWLPYCVFFLMGVGVYLFSRRIHLRLPDFLSVILLPATLVLLSLADNGQSTWGNNRWRVYAASISGLLMFWSVVQGRCYLSRFLKSRLLMYFGTISYSFYLWHAVVTFPLKFFFVRESARIGLPWAMFLFGVSGLLGSIAVAHVSYEILEKLIGRKLRAMWRERKLQVEHA